ncbi:MAG: DUF167 domain-containing protein [Candidatus Ranarchaeia archaeon]
MVARVQPKSNTFRWERHQEEIKFWLTSPPTAGKANKELVKRIAQICELANSKVRIVAGWKSRTKTIEIEETDLRKVDASFSRD